MRRGFFSFLIVAVCLSANATASRTITPARAATPPTLDGKLDETCWKQAQVVTNFSVLYVGRPAQYQTILRVAYDDENVYFAFKCIEPGADAIRAEKRTQEDRVFNDDCIEIMLDPLGTGETYFQFAVNAVGSKFDCAREQGGAIEEDDWQGTWHAAAFIGGDYWSVEIAIPYYTLGVTPQVKSTWRFNACRENKAPTELSSIAEDGSFHQTDQFAVLEKMDVDFSKYCYRIGAPKVGAVRVDGKLLGNIEVTVANETGAQNPIKVEGILRGADDELAIRTVRLAPKPGEKATCRMKALDLERLDTSRKVTCYVIVSDVKSKQVLAVSKTKVAVAYQPLKVVITEPFYRNTIYASQDLKQIVLNASVEVEDIEGLWLKADLMKPGVAAALASKTLKPLKSRRADITLPADALAVGDYVVRVELFDVRNARISSVERPLKKVPPHKGEIVVDRHLRLLIDGKPFLVNGYMSGNVSVMAQEGCNATHTYGAVYWKPHEGKAFLDTAHKNKVKVLIHPWGSTSQMGGRGLRLSDAEKEGLIRQVNLYKNHPGLLGWYMFDEPEASQSLERLREAYELVKDLDPYHPCIMLNNSLNGIAVFAGAGDVMMPDPYPQFTKTKPFYRGVLHVANFMDKIRTSAPGKAAWVALQAFDYGDDAENMPNQRGATFGEFRFMTYQAVIHGCKGFLHFAYGYSKRYPNLRIGIPHATRELNLLAPAILSPATEEVKVTPEESGVEALCKEHEGHIFIFAVNPNRSKRNASIALPKAHKATHLNVVRENRRVPVADGAFTDSFQPFGAHVYTTAELPPGKTVAETQKEIDAEEAKRRKKGNFALWMDNDVIANSSSWTHGGGYDSPRMTLNGVISEEGKEGWICRQPRQFPEWIRLTWRTEKTLGKVILYGTNVSDYEVQYWNGKDWAIAHSARGNEKKRVVHEFTPVKTTKLRIWITAANEPRSIISEIECYSR